MSPGDEFPRRLCDSLPPVTGILYYCWLAADLHHDDKIISQGVGGRRVYVGIRHPMSPVFIFFFRTLVAHELLFSTPFRSSFFSRAKV